MNPSFRSARCCLRPCSIASSVFAIAVSSFLWTSSDQGAGSMNFGAVVDSRSWGSESLQSLNYRLGAQVDAVYGWRAGIRVGYLTVRGRHSSSLSAPTDTRLFVSRRLFGSLESRLTVDLPTGYATQSESDMAITRRSTAMGWRLKSSKRTSTKRCGHPLRTASARSTERAQKSSSRGPISVAGT